MNSNFLRSIFKLFILAAVVAITALVTGCARQTFPHSDQQALNRQETVKQPIEDVKEDPLYVVNGRIVEIIPGAKSVRSSVWRIVQPGDVSTIEFLKGTAAINEWGEKGIHGVVMITTKGKTKIDID